MLCRTSNVASTRTVVRLLDHGKWKPGCTWCCIVMVKDDYIGELAIVCVCDSLGVQVMGNVGNAMGLQCQICSSGWELNCCGSCVQRWHTFVWRVRWDDAKWGNPMWLDCIKDSGKQWSGGESSPMGAECVIKKSIDDNKEHNSPSFQQCKTYLLRPGGCPESRSSMRWRKSKMPLWWNFWRRLRPWSSRTHGWGSG